MMTRPVAHRILRLADDSGSDLEDVATIGDLAANLAAEHTISTRMARTATTEDRALHV